MPTKDDMRWFKQQFHEKINAALEGTPYSLDFMTALACQETGEVWPILRKKNLSIDRILELCVGDTIDGRSAFPRSRAELESAPNGKKMFDIARAALVDMAQFIPSYQDVAAKPNKFCHGFGIFQYDIQFFKHEDPDYFLERRYTNFDASLKKALDELQSAAKTIGFHSKPTLTDLEKTFVAIAYNTGGFKPSLGLKQGFKSEDGKFYGEQVFSFIEQSKTVPVDDAGPLPTPDPVTPRYKVTSIEPLRLRKEAVIDPTNANVLTRLPNGQVVSAITNQEVNGFLEVETDFEGRHFKGFASAQFLTLV
jgi:hypothetical protein